MTTQHKNIPALRFPEFEGEWDEKRLGEVAKSISSGKTKPGQLGDVPVYGSMGIIGNSEVHTHDGTFILVARVGANAGALNVVTGKFAVTDNTLILDLEKDIKVLFIYYYLLQIGLNKFVFGSGQPLITGGQLKELALQLPSLKEQQQIADFLSAVDERIQQLTRKKELLEQYKKGVMQQLFSQQIRFKDDNGNDYPDWEEKRLGEVAKIKSGESPSKHKLRLTGTVPFLKVEDLNNSTKYQNISRQYTNEANNAINCNAVIFPKRGAAILTNKVRITTLPVHIDTNLMALEVLQGKLNAEYLFYFLIYEKLFKIADTSSIPQINNKHINPYIILFPHLLEQQKISDYLSGIDEKISSVQTEIEQTQLYKKGLLQQMFV